VNFALQGNELKGERLVASKEFEKRLLSTKKNHDQSRILLRNIMIPEEKLVGASGFEPPSSWSRTMNTKSRNALSGVAYGTKDVISPLLAVPNLYLTDPMDHPWERIGTPPCNPLCIGCRQDCTASKARCESSLQWPRSNGRPLLARQAEIQPKSVPRLRL